MRGGDIGNSTSERDAQVKHRAAMFSISGPFTNQHLDP
jgi:hypothetical protein